MPPCKATGAAGGDIRIVPRLVGEPLEGLLEGRAAGAVVPPLQREAERQQTLEAAEVVRNRGSRLLVRAQQTTAGDQGHEHSHPEGNAI
eukprot:11153917-Lingulodinium_polyedra.AAC.1